MLHAVSTVVKEMYNIACLVQSFGGVATHLEEKVYVPFNLLMNVWMGIYMCTDNHQHFSLLKIALGDIAIIIVSEEIMCIYIASYYITKLNTNEDLAS